MCVWVCASVCIWHLASPLRFLIADIFDVKAMRFNLLSDVRTFTNRPSAQASMIGVSTQRFLWSRSLVIACCCSAFLAPNTHVMLNLSIPCVSKKTFARPPNFLSNKFNIESRSILLATRDRHELAAC